MVKFLCTDACSEISKCDNFWILPQVSKENSGPARQVVHLQFKSWPNYGVPDEAGPISEFISRTQSIASRKSPDGESGRPELVTISISAEKF
jgi:protein tyrosine phosphatase